MINTIRNVLILLGLALWVMVAVVAIYRFGILERYNVSIGGVDVVLVRNSITGKQRICTAYGCSEWHKRKVEKVTIPGP